MTQKKFATNAIFNGKKIREQFRGLYAFNLFLACMQEERQTEGPVLCGPKAVNPPAKMMKIKGGAMTDSEKM